MTVLVILALIVIHELAHAAAAQMLGLRWKPFVRLPWKVGIAVWVDTPRQQRIIGLAGPASNLAAAAPLVLFHQPALAAVSVLMATGPSAVDWAATIRAGRRNSHAA